MPLKRLSCKWRLFPQLSLKATPGWIQREQQQLDLSVRNGLKRKQKISDKKIPIKFGESNSQFPEMKIIFAYVSHQ